VRYRYVFAGNLDNKGKADTVNIDWAVDRPVSRPLGARLPVQWHHFSDAAKDADLVILQQENKFLSSYAALVRAALGGPKVALFGHGKNFQASNPNSAAERWKRAWSKRVHWWFTYTDRCAEHLEGIGYARDRITVFNNSIDLSGIAKERAALTTEAADDLRARLVSGSDTVGVYVGGLYREKRLDFLIEAADAIRARVPGFHLLVIGNGPDAGIVRTAAETRPWLHYLGPLFGEEKTKAVALAKVWLMPGLVGLAVLDSFAYDTPMVTTNLPYHSPEFDYLVDGENGVVVDDANDVRAYAEAVARVLTDAEWRDKLVSGGRRARKNYSIENMALRFADGVMAALDAK